MKLSDALSNQAPQDQRPVYEAPAIIYEGVIATRAGSPVPPPVAPESGVDAADLFGD